MRPISSLWLLAFLSIPSPQAQAQTAPIASPRPKCNTREILQHHRASGLFADNQETIRFSDGSTMSNPYFDSSSRAQSESPSASRRTDEEINRIFAEVKFIALSEITKGKPKTSLDPEQRLMVERIEKLTMKIDGCSGTGQDGGPPGRNSLLSHQIILCQSARTMPTVALVQLLGHEIGHSNDLCTLGGSFYHRRNRTSPLENLVSIPEATTTTTAPTPNKRDIQVKSGSRPNRLEKRPFDPQEFRRNLREMSNADYMLDNSFEDDPQAMALIQQLSRQGHLEKLDEGIPLERNPLGPAYRCLSQRDSRTYDPLPATQEGVYAQRISFSEPGAQIWGARLLARYLEKNPVSERDALGIFANVQIYPNSKKPPGEKEIDLNQIYFSEPAIQRAIGCTPDPRQNCLSYFNPDGAGSGKSSGDSSSSTALPQGTAQ